MFLVLAIMAASTETGNAEDQKDHTALKSLIEEAKQVVQVRAGESPVPGVFSTTKVEPSDMCTTKLAVILPPFTHLGFANPSEIRRVVEIDWRQVRWTNLKDNSTLVKFGPGQSQNYLAANDPADAAAMKRIIDKIVLQCAGTMPGDGLSVPADPHAGLRGGKLSWPYTWNMRKADVVAASGGNLRPDTNSASNLTGSHSLFGKPFQADFEFYGGTLSKVLMSSDDASSCEAVRVNYGKGKGYFSQSVPEHNLLISVFPGLGSCQITISREKF